MSISEAPILSTPVTHILEGREHAPKETASSLTDDELCLKYEVQRTIAEIRKAKYARIALQFPDSMLSDAPRVFDLLTQSAKLPSTKLRSREEFPLESSQLSADVDSSREEEPPVRFYILADTSYGTCCVDEIAAEHVNADVVVHYGRACLSPTSHVQVIHVFTVQALDHQILLTDFKNYYADMHMKIIIMADVTYLSHLEIVRDLLQRSGYKNIFITKIRHDPSSPLPNRTTPEEVEADPSKLKEWHLFHISDPPKALLLTVASHVASIRIFSTSRPDQFRPDEQILATTGRALNRRYALITSIITVSIFGILINTLSVKNYLHIVEHVKARIIAAGKKSYTFVVGKVNAAKVANFSEIGAWIMIGCWESSLIDSKDFWKPILTPFELEVALKGDEERVWTGKWSSDFQELLERPGQTVEKAAINHNREPDHDDDGALDQDTDSEPESEPPEFDLRTGRYVSHPRPLQSFTTTRNGTAPHSQTLIKRAKGDVATVGGEASPGAEHLRSRRTWRGLGSDFEIAYDDDGAAVEQGRSGIARGYTHGENGAKT